MQKQSVKHPEELRRIPVTPEPTQQNAEADMHKVQRAVTDIRSANPDTVLQLQRMYGNKAVTNLVQRVRERSKAVKSDEQPDIDFGRKERSNAIKSDEQPDVDFGRKQRSNAVKMDFGSNGGIQQNTSDLLEMVMNDKVERELLRTYCEEENSTENFDFYLAVKKYKKGIQSSPEAQAIYDEFIKSGSERQANLSGSVVKSITSVITDPNPTVFLSNRSTIFDKAFTECGATLISDTYLRLTQTDAYKKAKEAEKLEGLLKENNMW